MQAPDRLDALDPTRGLVRLVRGSGVGAAAVGVSLVGHAAGPSPLPSATTLVGTLAASAAIAWALSFARWTLVSLTGVLVAAQSVFHVAFSGSGAAAADHLTWPMLLGHVVATVVMVGVLRRGEALLWAVTESLGLRVWQILRGFAGLPRPTVPTGFVIAWTATPRCWHGSEPPRRGPPLGSRPLSVPA